jgi:Domain of unknown function (DUF1844)
MGNEENFNEEHSKFVIKDKRRFSSEGEEQKSSEESPKSSTKDNNVKIETKSKNITQETQTPPFDSAGLRQELDFSSFIVSLASQALWQMGVAAPPEGISILVDLEAAKETIDILGMLHQKTSGNLSDSEAKLMENILHELRLSFVRVGKVSQK